ncbi:MAG TPA: DinB family protein [Chitinophagaceae bacterium]|nr:DinB family protein [Chitinophagaceae bacterium]
MEKNNVLEKESVQPLILTADALLNHWQGHRKLTRRVIEAFPEKELFEYSVGGMRPFADLAKEMIYMAGPGVQGLATNEWRRFEESDTPPPTTKEAILQLWDETTQKINDYWPQIPSYRFQETIKAFGQWEGSGYWILFYFIDNEIHHRGQGYVYLRSLGIEPPPFWDR